MKELFASDYGVLDASVLKNEYVSNPAELLRSQELCGVLRLCGVCEDESGASASDWELFLSFCRCLPLLKGHLLAARAERLLQKTLLFSLPLCEENAVALWREGIARLEESPLRMRSLLDPAVPWLC